MCPASQSEMRGAAEKLRDEYGSNVIVTMGAQGAPSLCFQAGPILSIRFPYRSSVAGAGDGVLAGMALSYLRKESLEYGLLHGFALAGAILQTLPTADLEVEDYEALLPQIRMEPLQTYRFPRILLCKYYNYQSSKSLDVQDASQRFLRFSIPRKDHMSDSENSQFEVHDREVLETARSIIRRTESQAVGAGGDRCRSKK